MTNTSFSPKALEFLDELSDHLRRAAYEELCQWLVGNLVMQPTPKSRLPGEIRIPGGPVVKIPESTILDPWGRPVADEVAVRGR